MNGFVLCLLSLFIVSCAKDQVVISTKEVSAYEEFSGVTPLKEKVSIQLISVDDKRKREMTDVIGEARTGGSYTKTPVLLEKALVDFMKGFLQEELIKRGFVFDPDAEHEMRVSIKDFWLEEIIERYQPEKAHCRIELDIEITKSGDRFFSNLWSEVTSPGDLGDATSKLGDTMASCLNSAVEQFVRDGKLQDFLDRNRD